MKTSIMKKLLIVLAPVLLLAATVGSYIYGNKVIGIYSQQNFATDGDFEKSTYGVSLSGGGSTAVAITSGGGIFGNALSITTPQNNDEVRLGISTTTGLGGLNCEARFNLKLFSTNTSPTIVDVDVISNAGTLSISNTQRVSLSVNNVWVPVSVNFPCSRPVAATFGRIKIIDAGVASSGTPIVYTDSFYAGEATNITNQVVVTDWQDFPSVAAGTLITATTTNPSYGTVVTNKAQYRYVGSDVEISWAFRQTTAGSAGSGYYLFNIPSSICVIDTSKVKANTSFAAWPTDYDSYVGTFASGYTIVTETGNGRGWVSVYSASQLKVALQITTTTGDSYVNAWRHTFLNFGEVINFGMNAKLPCVGRSATQSAITQQCIKDGSCENTFSAFIAADGTVSGENIDWINGNASISDTSLYTIPVKISNSAAMNCEVNVSIASFDGGNLTARTEGTQTASNIYVRTGFTNSGNLNFTKGVYPFRIICQRSSTDYKPRFSAPALVGSVTSNSTSALRVEGVKLSSTGVVNYETSDWISGNCSGSSPYACTINAGVFSATPVCVATSGVGASFAAETFTVLTSTAFTIQKIGNNAGATEVICFGLR